MDKLTAKELLELYEDEQIESSYGIRSAAVLGFEDVQSGHRPLYPETVYLLGGDETSGIIGLLFPNGDFIPTLEPKVTAKYWEFDETLKYEAIPGEMTPEGTPRVIGNSWTEGEVLWDGCAGEIEPHVDMTTEIEVRSSQKDKGTMFVKTMKATVSPHIRRQDINAITGDWDTYRKGQGDARTTGAVHITFGEDDGGFSGMPSHRRAA